MWFVGCPRRERKIWMAHGNLSTGRSQQWCYILLDKPPLNKECITLSDLMWCHPISNDVVFKMYDRWEPVSIIALTVRFFQFTSKLTKVVCRIKPEQNWVDNKIYYVFLLPLSPWLDSSVHLPGTGTSSYSLLKEIMQTISCLQCFNRCPGFRHKKHPFLFFSVSYLLCSDNLRSLEQALLSSELSQNKQHTFSSSHQTIYHSPLQPFSQLVSSSSPSMQNPHSARSLILLRNFFHLFKPHHVAITEGL